MKAAEGDQVSRVEIKYLIRYQGWLRMGAFSPYWLNEIFAKTGLGQEGHRRQL